jgi:predicted amidohydrolase
LLASAFPNPRLEHWKTLLRARAIENQMFVIASNQVGQEDFGNGGLVNYFGASAIIDPWGKVVVEAGESDEVLLTATIDTDLAQRVRGKMNVLADRRPELYETHLKQAPTKPEEC